MGGVQGAAINVAGKTGGTTDTGYNGGILLFSA